MSKELSEAKFHGFQLGVQITTYLSEQKRPVTFMEALGIMRDMADGNLTIYDPENAGRGFDAGTAAAIRNTNITSIALQ